jgi:hypothetical protein
VEWCGIALGGGREFSVCAFLSILCTKAGKLRVSLVVGILLGGVLKFRSESAGIMVVPGAKR